MSEDPKAIWERIKRETEENKRKAMEAYRQVLGVSPKSQDLEAKGWQEWLMTLFPFSFEEDFSEDHIKFWDLFWSLLFRIKGQREYIARNEPIPERFVILPDEYVILLILGRGLAKSSSMEASSLMRGAILGGYSLTISEAQDQAEEHIGNIRILITHSESRLLEFYPEMTIEEGAVIEGVKSKDRTDLFITKNGWICRAKGLNSRLRGLRIGNKRPDDINLDDIDGVNDSAAVSIKKLKQLTASVIPTQARRHSTIKFGQNLIAENSVMNQIFTGASDALAARTVIGVSKTFSYFEYETKNDPKDGRLKHYISQDSIPTWAGVDIAQAQKFLHDAGLATFLVEYQNEFDHLRQGLVLQNYSDDVHVISKSEFASVFGSREIPQLWTKYVAHDWARTKTAYHACVVSKIAVSPQYSKLAGHIFMFDPMSFPANTEADDVALRLLKSISPFVYVNGNPFEWDELIGSELERSGLNNFTSNATELIEARRSILARIIPKYTKTLLQTQRYVGLRMSHEQAKGVALVYQNVFGLPFVPINPGADGGIELINFYQKIDMTQDHPFRQGEKGMSRFWIIVDDDPDDTSEIKRPVPLSKVVRPDDLHDSQLLRYQFAHWQYLAPRISERGEMEYTHPQKMNDDYGNSIQMLFCQPNYVKALPMTEGEETEVLIAETNPEFSLQNMEKDIESGKRDATAAWHARQMLMYHLEQQKNDKVIQVSGLARRRR